MSFLKDLGIGGGGPMGMLMGGMGSMMGKGGGEYNPLLGLLGSQLFGGKGGGSEGGESPAQPAAPAAPQPNGAAKGLEHLLGADPSRISSLATSIGKGANVVASAGGAQGGYEAPRMPAINNQMQLLDPRIIQQLMRHFNGGGTGQMQ